MTVTTFASFSVGDKLAGIPIEAFLAIMTISSGSVMATFDANPSALLTRENVQFFIKPTLSGVEIAVTSHTLVSILIICPGPRAVRMESLTFLTIVTCRVVFAVTLQSPFSILDTFRGMSVTLTPPSDSEVRQRVVITLPRRFVIRTLIPKSIKLTENHHDVRRCYPVLEDGAIIKIIS